MFISEWDLCPELNLGEKVVPWEMLLLWTSSHNVSVVTVTYANNKLHNEVLGESSKWIKIFSYLVIK